MPNFRVHIPINPLRTDSHGPNTESTHVANCLRKFADRIESTGNLAHVLLDELLGHRVARCGIDVDLTPRTKDRDNG